jgi:O-antigen/teichoic acid export membrane protein
MLAGTARVFLAELLILPTGLLVTALLTRRLGAAGYGLFALTATLVTWIEWSVTSIFARATIKFAAEAADWRGIGSTVLRLHLLAGAGAAVLLWLSAPLLGRLLHEREIVAYLRLFALDIPLFSMAQAHRNLLVGIGSFGGRALATAGRWVSRLLLIALLVEAGLSVRGAILGSIGASVVELAVSRRFARPSLLDRDVLPARQLWSYALPLFLTALSSRLFDKLDLFALKSLGATAAQAGIYAAAQNLALLPAIFSLAFAPLLLSTLSRLFAAGDRAGARAMCRDALRVVFWLLPVAGIVAGAAPAIVGWVFGRPFLPAAPLLACLSFAGVALVMLAVAVTILTAAGRPGWTFGLVGPLLPLALAGHLFCIPRWGAAGAALVTTAVACLGGLMGMLAVHRCCRVLPPAATAGRSVLIAGAAAALAALWPASGLWLLLKLPATLVMVAPAFMGLGELDAGEIAGARAWLRRYRARQERARAWP